MDDAVLIEMVKANPIIYDRRHNLYKDHRTKEQVWSKISMETNVPATECKKKWTYLRDKYQKEWRRCTRLGEKGEYSAPVWSLYSHLYFLEEHVKTRDLSINYEQLGTDCSSPPKSEPVALIRPYEAYCASSSREERNYFMKAEADVYATSPSESAGVTSHKSQKRSKRRHHHDDMKDVIKLIKDKVRKKNDHIETFSEFVKSYLRRWPDHAQDEAIAYITNYVVQKNMSLPK